MFLDGILHNTAVPSYLPCWISTTVWLFLQNLILVPTDSSPLLHRCKALSHLWYILYPNPKAFQCFFYNVALRPTSLRGPVTLCLDYCGPSTRPLHHIYCPTPFPSTHWIIYWNSFGPFIFIRILVAKSDKILTQIGSSRKKKDRKTVIWKGTDRDSAYKASG